MVVEAREAAEGDPPRASYRPSGRLTVRMQIHGPCGSEKPRL